MPGKAAKVTVTERQHEICSRCGTPPPLRRISGNEPSSSSLAFDGLRNEDIAEEVGLGQRQVGRWRRRSARAWCGLSDRECRETEADWPGHRSGPHRRTPPWRSPGKFTPSSHPDPRGRLRAPRSRAGRSPTGRPTNWPTRSSRRHRHADLDVSGEPPPPRGSRPPPQKPVLAQHHREGPERLQKTGRGGL